MLERMEKIDMPFLMHGEDVDPAIDIFDREAHVHRALSVEMGEAVSRAAHHPGAPVVEGRRRFREERGAAGRRHHHALSHDPHAHRLVRLGPEALSCTSCRSSKPSKDRLALRKAATSGEACYFLGTDSAPHPVAKKLAVNGIPGIFNAPVAIATYAKVFEEEGALDKLEAFASLNGPQALQAAAQRGEDHARKVVLDRARRRSRSRARTSGRWSIAAARRLNGAWSRTAPAANSDLEEPWLSMT